MDVAITVNIWFLASMCLVSVLIGMILGVRAASRGRSDRYR